MNKFVNFFEDYKIGNEKFFNHLLESNDDYIIEFILILNQLIEDSYSSKTELSNLNFIANSTLSGSSFPCGEVHCKLKNINNLARNSVLYADSVYIQNPFEKYSTYNNFNEKLKYDLISDLILINNTIPLLRNGIFKIAKSKFHFCIDCFNRFEKNYLSNFNYNLDIIRPLILEYILSNTEFVIKKIDKQLFLEISGSSDLLKHPTIISFIEEPEIFKNLKTKEGQSIKLDKKFITDNGVANILINEIEDNLAYQDFYSQYYSANMLTDRDFDISLFNLINKQKSTSKSNVLSNVNHIVPFIQDVPLEKLLKLRKQEGESFKVYRDKLNSLIKSSSISSENEATDFYLDEIKPELNKIKSTIKNNKKFLWNNINSNIFLASTYVSASLFTGILPPNIDTIVASIGGFGFAKTISDDVIKLIKKPQTKENELYFLWKIVESNKIKI